MSPQFRGSVRWKETFKEQFGDVRWKRLKKSLNKENLVFAFHPDMRSTFSNPLYNSITMESFNSRLEKLELEPCGLPYCYSHCKRNNNHNNDLKNQSIPGTVKTDLPLVYIIDAASCIAANLLGVQPGHSVLDFCSVGCMLIMKELMAFSQAPGGKTLLFMSLLFSNQDVNVVSESESKNSLLVCHDTSRERLIRLRDNVFKRCDVDILARNRIRVIHNSQQAISTGPFDRILLDAPCSTDRHVMRDPLNLALWNPARIKRNAQRQFDLLLSVIPSLRRSRTSRLLYCTCALSSTENDKVIERLLNDPQYKHRLCVVSPQELVQEFNKRIPTFFLRVMPLNSTIDGQGSPLLDPQDMESVGTRYPQQNTAGLTVEHTKYGVICLPDVSRCGPLYASALQWMRMVDE